MSAAAVAPASVNFASHVFLVDIPHIFVEGSFGELLTAFTLSHDILPIALYCGTGCGKGNALPFVYTNPQPETRLFERDKVYVLAESAEYAQWVCDHVNETDKLGAGRLVGDSTATSGRRDR